MCRKLVGLIAVLVFLVPFAHADEASKRAKIEEMLAVIKIDGLMKQAINQSMTQSQQMVRGMFGDHPMSASDQRIMDDFTSKTFLLISQAFDWQKLKPAYVDLYAPLIPRRKLMASLCSTNHRSASQCLRNHQS